MKVARRPREFLQTADQLVEALRHRAVLRDYLKTHVRSRCEAKRDVGKEGR